MSCVCPLINYTLATDEKLMSVMYESAHVVQVFPSFTGFYRTQYPASYTHKSLDRTLQFTLPASAGRQTCLLCLSLKSQIPKLFRNNLVFPIFTAYL